jgi:type I restriction enzyme, S subunit
MNMTKGRTWNDVPLKFLFSKRSGGAWGVDPDFEDKGIVCLRAADFMTHELRHKIVDLTKRKYEDKEIASKQLLKGDLILEKSGGGDKQLVGRVVSFDLNEPALCSNFLEVLRPRQSFLHSRFGTYLFYSLWSTRSVLKYIKQTTGIQNLDVEDYLSQIVGIPPLSIQRQVSDYLDRETQKIDSLIAAKKRLLELLAEKRRSMITQAVTRGLAADVPMKDSAIEWLGEVPAHWNVEHLKYHLSSIEQGWSPQSDNFPADLDEWGVLKVGAVNGWAFNSNENKRIPPELEIPVEYEIKPGDILISRANTIELVGSASLVKEVRPRLLLCDKIYRPILRGCRLSPDYLVFYLRSLAARFEVERDATGASSSMQNISQGTIANLWIPRPPIDEQISIVTHIQNQLSLLEKLELTTKQGISLLQERRTSLISTAVTGQLSIPD